MPPSSARHFFHTGPSFITSPSAVLNHTRPRLSRYMLMMEIALRPGIAAGAHGLNSEPLKRTSPRNVPSHR